MIRITLDTNQLVRALMRPPELATFMMSWQSNRFRAVASHELLEDVKMPPVKRLLQQYNIQVVSTEQLLALIDSTDSQSNR